MSLLIEGVPRRYAWGSPTVIQRMAGLAEDGRPIAEFWFGAHPLGPSPVPSRALALDEVLAGDPAALLGGRTVQRFGPHLPFLVKVLAVRAALSIQVHPSAEHAWAGFEREQAAGVPIDAAHRNYRDRHHKPELLCALTPFTALCGFRAPADTLGMLTDLGVPELAFLADRLAGPDPLRSAFIAVLELPDPGPVVDALTRALVRLPDGPLRTALRFVIDDFPGDVGLLLALLLNPVRLEPGEAIGLAPGTVHAYLRGIGVEVMANSDNVLRCGLTGKHVDVAEVLRVTDFSALEQPRLPRPLGGRYAAAADEFALTRLEVEDPVGLDDPGPCIVLCTEGSVSVGEHSLAAGQSVFVPAGEATTIAGRGLVFVASTG